MFRYRFVVLLVLLLLLLVTAPVVAYLQRPLIASVAINSLFMAIILSAVYSVSEKRMTVMVAWVLASLAIAVQILDHLSSSDPLTITRHALHIVVLLYAIILILEFIFTHRKVTINTIYASLCTYLLIGLLWAVVYSLIYSVNPQAFVDSRVGEGEELSMRFGSYSIAPIYYSLVTLTTLGYGDVTPVSPSARMLSAIEAVLGQLYIAVLVARLVGLHISQSGDHDS
jgi:hypothetical protein